MSKKYIITEQQFKRLVENIIKEKELSSVEQDEIMQHRIKHDKDVIGSDDYDIFKDKRAGALVKSLLDHGEEVGFIHLIPKYTNNYGMNEYKIKDDRYLVTNPTEIKRFKEESKYYNDFSSEFYDLQDGYWIYKFN